jgi:hypothetical protein
MAEDLDWDLEAFDKAFQEVFQLGMAKADWKSKLVWIPNAIKHNRPESPNVVKSWSNQWDLLPECDLKWEVYEALKSSVGTLGEAYAKAFDEALPKPSRKAFGKASEKSFQDPQRKPEKTELSEPVTEVESKSLKCLPMPESDHERQPNEPLKSSADKHEEAFEKPSGEPFGKAMANQEQEQEQYLGKHLSKANTSVRKNSASPESGESENASALSTLSAPDGAVIVQVSFDEDAPSGACGQRKSTDDTPSPDGNIPEGNLLPEAGTPGRAPIVGSRYLDAAPEAFMDHPLPASVPGDEAIGVTPSSQDALSSSKLSDQIAIEGLSLCSPHSTTHPDSEDEKTLSIGIPQDVSSSRQGLSPEPPIVTVLEELAPEEASARDQSREANPADRHPSSGTVNKVLFYLTKRRRKLSGWKLEYFNEFMIAFALKKGRAEAADAWLDIPDLTPELASRIINAARQEARARPTLQAKGISPKWAQGWLSARRWEDWEVGETTEDDHGKESQCGQDEAYQQSLREAVKRFL